MLLSIYTGTLNMFYIIFYKMASQDELAMTKICVADEVAYTTAFDELSSIPSLLLEVTRAAATKDTVPRNVGCSSGSSPGM